MRARLVPILLSVLLVATLVPSAQANPAVPYCPGSASPLAGTPLIRPDVCKAITGRVFPEASPLSTPPGQLPASDFVSFFEAKAGLEYLNATYPDWMTLYHVADSYGLCAIPGPSGGPCTQRDRFPVMAVEVTNEKSPVPMDKRLQLLFMLSIHGVEKGGREGGLRVIEDFVSGMGIANQKVQDGAGLQEAIAKPTGGQVQTYRDYLDFTRLVFLFPNSDGWAHDEAPYVTQDPSCGVPPNGVLFCRTNGNGTDLNRQLPTVGWQLIAPAQGRLPVNEPEPAGYLPWLEKDHRFNYAIDIHGMLNHHNFAAIMMPAGSFTPQEMLRSTRLAETLKERLNGDTHFAGWKTALGTADDEGAPAGQALGGTPAAGPINDNGPCSAIGEGCLDGGSPTGGYGSDTFADWGTVWDAIGYTDSGFSGDFFAQNTGLNAPGYDIEMAYNHITTDSQYEGPGSLFNDFHVEMVRHIVKSFMDAAAQDVRVSVETHGTRTAVLKTTFVATNLDDKSPNPGGWADSNPKDDLWQYSKDKPFFATPAKYWSDLAPFLRDGDRPGVLATLGGPDVNSASLGHYTSFVIPGSAIQEIQGDPAKIDAVKAYVQDGGTLVLTDEGMRFLDLSGITSGAVAKNLQYAGAVDMDRSHELTKGVRGFARQTYEPVPLGYTIQSLAAPTWYVDAAKFTSAGGNVAGVAVIGQAGGPDAQKVTLGELKLGKGTIKFIGALLPDPSEEFYHPYGLDDYAATYSGNQILRNMLGWEEVFSNPPVVIQGDGTIVQSPNEAHGAASTATATQSPGKGTPGLGLVMVLAGVAAALLVARRRA